MSAHGRHVWYELMTNGPEAAKTFYGDVVGWTTQEMPMPGGTYTLLMAGETATAGLMEQPEEMRRMGVPPSWRGFVAAEDVDAAAAKVTRLGGQVHVPPTDVPGVGRFAIVADPQGAAFALFKASSPGPEQTPEPGTPGHIGWHELYAQDWEKAFAFYAELFGWQKADAIDMGEMGTYQLFSAGGPPVGGMFNKPPSMPAPSWLYYANVASVDQAADRISAGGGRILNGPMQVPGGTWIVQATDPEGVMFAIVGPRN
jgi:predicted enzyme related to lactoylglutathione lyase